MGFVMEVRMLANLFNSKKVIIELVEEYEKDVENLKERVINLRGNIALQEEEFETLSKLELDLREDISTLNEKIQSMKDEIQDKKSEIITLNEGESAEFIKNFTQKYDYKIEPLEFLSVRFALRTYRELGEYCYKKEDFLKAVNIYIQEISAKEGVSYTKLKKAIFDINPAWLEIYESTRTFCPISGTTTKLLLTTFMVPQKNSKKQL